MNSSKNSKIKSQSYLVSIAIGLTSSLPLTVEAQTNSSISPTAAIESLSEQMSSMMLPILYIFIAMWAIKFFFKIYNELSENTQKEEEQEKYRENIQKTVVPVEIKSNSTTASNWDWKNKANEMLTPEALKPQEPEPQYWIKDKELKTLWLAFEEKLLLVQSHKNYDKNYMNHRNIEALKGNMLAVLEPYIANAETGDKKEFYLDIRLGIIKTLNNANVYLNECEEDLINISKKSMKADLIYLEKKLNS